MSKKDYELIARALKDSKPNEPNLHPHAEFQYALVKWDMTCENISHALQQDNPRFNRAKFLQACGYND